MDTLPTLLSKDEIETPRTAADILAWVYSAHRRFQRSKELRGIAREGRFFAKQLVEESLPIALFVDRFYTRSAQVEIKQVLGNQSYDATVVDGRSSPDAVTHIESTVADMDHNESLRMELLSAKGTAPAVGVIPAKGSKRRRTELRGEACAYDPGEVADQRLLQVRNAVAAKAQNQYPNGTALVVRIDDAIAFRDQPEIDQLDALAKDTLMPMLSGREFRVLSMVGSQGLYLDYRL
jgi:hypothetical protein